METRTKTVLATSLVLLWAGLVAWQWRFLDEPVRVPLTNVTGPPLAGRHAAAMGTNWHVNLGLLASVGVQREGNFTIPRNIFAIPSSDGSLPLSQATALEYQHNPAPGETVSEQVEEDETTRYRYLGFLRMGESRQKDKALAVLSKGDEVLVLKVGDHVEDHVILRAITAESVTMRDTDTRIEKTVPLSDETMEQE